MDVITGREPEQLCKSRLAALTGRILAPDSPHRPVMLSFFLVFFCQAIDFRPRVC